MVPEHVVRPIGIVHSPWTEPAGTPIQGAFLPDAVGVVEVFAEFAEGLADVEGFSHLWLLYLFHRRVCERLVVTPFMDNTPRGVFATRAPSRPNSIGLSPVRLLRREGTMLHVAELDILDGTPLLDIKPYVVRFDRRDSTREGWLGNVDDSRGMHRADERFDGER